jgi:hypothetical protein
LRKARQRAQELHRDPWQFAIQIQFLRQAGVSPTDLREPVTLGYVETRRETTTARGRERTFVRAPPLRFGERSCFILTDKAAAALSAGAQLVSVPSWNQSARELRYGGRIVKRRSH